MDTLRLFVSLFNLGFIAITCTSPSSGLEMGEKKGDVPSRDGRVSKMFLKFCFTITVYSFLTYYHILNFSTESLTIFEYLMISIAFCGFNLRLWSFLTLGDMFTFTIGLRENHTLIQHGPYQYLVHPSYTGQILHMFSTLLFLLNSYYAVTIYFVLFILAIYDINNRIRIEERTMFGKFGDSYLLYVKSRYRLIPYIY